MAPIRAGSKCLILCFAPLLASSAGAATLAPHFSGVWGRESIPKSPASGPGPITNMSHTVDALIGDYTNPILKPATAEALKQHGEISTKGAYFSTPHNQCRPEAPPYILIELQMEMIQAPNEVLLIYGGDHEVRHVRLNAAHSVPVTPSWYGNSVGHYEGDTLVVDTIGIKVTPLSMIDVYGTPYSPSLHVVERYRLIDGAAAKAAAEKNEHENGRTYTAIVDRAYTGKGLQVQFTIEDQGAFTVPWSAAVTYRRAYGDWPELACAENPHDYSAGRDAAIPVAQKLDF